MNFRMTSQRDIAIQRLEELGLSAIQAADAAGIDRNFIRDLVKPSSKKESVRAINLPNLAKALWLDHDALAAGRMVRLEVPPEEAPRAKIRGGDTVRVPLSEVEQPEIRPRDEQATTGEYTGNRGIPDETVPVIDVTSGLGAGGVTIVADGIPGSNGYSFSAEHVIDYWRVPSTVLRSFGVRARDCAILPTQGDSMVPTLLENEFVLIDIRHRVPSPAGIYALNDAFGGIIVKRLNPISRPADEDQRVEVISDNAEKYPKDEWSANDLRIVGRVIMRFGYLR